MTIDFDLDTEARAKIFSRVIHRLDRYLDDTGEFRVTQNTSLSQARKFVAEMDLGGDLSPTEALDHVMGGLEKYAVHTPHPGYFGLFNPRANFPSILADLITATYNPQMAAWSHAPFAAEVEARMIREFGQKFGYESSQAHGTFASGGTEANITALLCALNNRFPNFAKGGLYAVGTRPIVYCSSEAHHSVHRAARVAGLGLDSVRVVDVDDNLRFDVTKLEDAISQDIKAGNCPLMLVGTGGTTGTGTVDDLEALAKVAGANDLWFHVDAAWGGGAIMSSELESCLRGIERSDSITFDAHKWMSVPMGASMLLTSHREVLHKTFRLTADYMPNDAEELGVEDPYSFSMQWSRRFIGLKVYLSLLFFGWEGYESTINHQAKMGNRLRELLIESGWTICNRSQLPVVCFTDDSILNSGSASRVLDNVYATGRSWISLYHINDNPVFRACITNYQTQESDVCELVSEMNQHRVNFA